MNDQAGPVTIELVRPYGRFALITVMFGGAAAFLAHRASTNDRGLVINGIIHLGPSSADVFYAVLAILSVGFVAIGLLALRAFHARKTLRVVIGKTQVTMPGRFRAWEGFQEDVTLRYEDLLSIAVGPQFLRILRRDGQSLFLAKHFVPEGWTLRSLADRIMGQARTRADALAAKATRKAAAARAEANADHDAGPVDERARARTSAARSRLRPHGTAASMSPSCKKP